MTKCFGIVLSSSNATGKVADVAIHEALHGAIQVIKRGDCVEVSPFDQVVDHALKAHGPPIVRMVNALDTVCVQLLDFFWKDGSAPSTKNFNVPRIALVKQVLHVFEVLHVPSLIGSHGDGLRIFLNGRGDHFIDASVVTEMNDLTARPLHDSSHDVDGGVVSIKKAGCRNDADLVLWDVRFRVLHGVAWDNAKLGQTLRRPSLEHPVDTGHFANITFPRPIFQDGVPTFRHSCLKRNVSLPVRVSNLEAASVQKK